MMLRQHVKVLYLLFRTDSFKNGFLGILVVNDTFTLILRFLLPSPRFRDRPALQCTNDG